jgi:RHS repeat-associated protein
MQSDGTNRYAFDAENRIACMNPDVNWVCNVNSVSYNYDAGGRRVKKSSGTNYWYGPGGQALAETDSSGAWTNYIFFGGQRLARNISGDIKYYITDHLHSTAMFVDKAGTMAAILDDNDMYPWGGIVPGVGKTTSNNTVKFTGQYRDTESQLDYFGARYYSNTIGRFMSPDWAAKPTTVPYAKFGDPQSLNLYSYTENGPINRIDGDGHMAVGFSTTGVFYVGGTGVNDGTGGLTSPWGDYHTEERSTTLTYSDGSTQTISNTVTYQGGTSAAGPALKGPYVADLKSKEIAPLLDLNHKSSDKDVVGPNGQCVDLTKKFSGMGDVSAEHHWYQGEKVSDAKDIKPGTAIASFNDKGRFPSESGWNSGIYLGKGTNGTIWILDQWPGHPPEPRPILVNNNALPANNSAAYSVILTGPWR